MPQEVSDQSTQYLSPNDVLALETTGVPIRNDGPKHTKIWAKLFKSMDWLDAAVLKGANPILVGHGLRNIEIDGEGAGHAEGGEIHIFLLSMDFIGDSVYVAPKIRDCLQDHDLDRKHNAHIHGTNIIVHICEAADICFALVGARDHTVYQSLDQLVSDGVTAFLPYIGPTEVQVIPISIRPSEDNPMVQHVDIRFEFERYTLEHPNVPGCILEWLFVPESEDREGEEDHERYVGPEEGREIARETAMREN